MTLSPHARSTTAALLRWFSTWLALFVLLQGLAAAQALGSGPLHRHGQSGAHTQRGHHHDGAERHHHSGGDAMVTALVVADAEPEWDSAAFAITAALSLMALAGWRGSATARGQVWRRAPAWAWQTHDPATPRRPPRPA